MKAIKVFILWLAVFVLLLSISIYKKERLRQEMFNRPLVKQNRLNRYYFDSTRDYYLQEKPQPVLFKKSDIKFYRLVDKGIASWYSTKFCLGCHPKRIMANGEKLRDDNYTVAYNHLPLNTWVIVRNTLNGKEVRARVTDRGGFEKYNRIIDLNKATAEAIGCGGLCQVEVYVEEK